MVADHAWPTGLAFLGVGENQVDVGGYVELEAAELAHADHDQILFAAAILAERRAVLRAQPAVDPRERETQGGVGKQRGGGHYFAQVGESAQVARDQAQHDLLAQLAQGLFQCVFVGNRSGGQGGLHFLGAPCQIQFRGEAVLQFRRTFRQPPGEMAEVQGFCDDGVGLHKRHGMSGVCKEQVI
ncbi:hypothetical protein LDC_0852 [sediment metagenome]|uniref:Uncharacterized protein n=1 Tax=sediment metagenome TaxID=749907 RepID=D9PH53_9ZZZZ